MFHAVVHFEVLAEEHTKIIFTMIFDSTEECSKVK
jgi:hypothetical protein